MFQVILDNICKCTGEHGQDYTLSVWAKSNTGD